MRPTGKKLKLCELKENNYLTYKTQLMHSTHQKIPLNRIHTW